MKLRSILIAGILALPTLGSATTLKEEAGDAWDTTKHVATRTGETIENGAVKTGRFVEHGVQKTGTFVEHGISPVTDRLHMNATPAVTLNEGQIMTPGTVSTGSDLIVRNRGDRAERFEIKGHQIEDRVLLKPGQSKRLDLDLPRGNYEMTSSDGGMTHLRVR